MANEFATTDNSGTLKQDYVDPVGEALKRKRLKLAQSKGIEDNKPVDTQGGLYGIADS
jgi:hypothetical protein